MDSTIYKFDACPGNIPLMLCPSIIIKMHMNITKSVVLECSHKQPQ